MLDACPEHGWRPPRGPGGHSAKGLCPGCTMWRDIQSGRVRLDEEGVPQAVGSRPRDPAKRVYRDGGRVSDGPPVSTQREPTPYEDEAWSRFLSTQEDARREEQGALVRIAELRRIQERRDKPRRRRVQSELYQNGEWVVCYAPERRRDPWILETDEFD